MSSKYYTKMPDGSFREDNLFWNEISNGSWNVCDTIIAILAVGLIAFAIIYAECFATVTCLPI